MKGAGLANWLAPLSEPDTHNGTLTMILIKLAIDAALIALFGWTMVRLHYVLFDRLARRRRARWERDLT